MAAPYQYILPKTLTKKQLCLCFGLDHPGGHLDYRSLKLQYFTDKALAELEITEAEYHRIRKFDALKTKRIITYFRLEPLLRRII